MANAYFTKHKRANQFTSEALNICIIWLLSLTVAGSIEWTLQENPAIFGTNIHLVCHLPTDGSCCNDYRKWNVGSKYVLIILNGLSYNTSKYKEDLIVKDRLSVLTIFSLSKFDVNVPYECVYGFKKSRYELELTEESFEFHPTEKLPVVPDVSGCSLSFHLQFKRVFPIPTCQATLGVQNVSSFLNISVIKKDIFYESSLAFNYSTLEVECTTSLRVVCTVGKTALTVVDYKASTSSSANNTVLVLAIVTPIVVLLLIIFIVIVVYNVHRVTKHRTKYLKDRGTDEQQNLQANTSF